MVESLEQTTAQIVEYWRLIVRHKWPVLVGTLALTLVFILAIVRMRNVYQATTTILVDPQQIPEKYVSPAVSTDPGERLNVISQQVLSRTRLQAIITRFNLYPELRRSAPPEVVVEEMRRDITIQVKQGSGPELSTFTITFQGPEPALVAEVANQLATSFIRWNISSREQLVSGTKEFLSSELREAKQNLEQQENRLRQFKMSHLGETPDQTANNLQALTSLRSALQVNQEAMGRLDEERLLLTRLPEPVTAPGGNLSGRARLQLEKRQLEASLQQLRTQYSDRHPDVVRLRHQLAQLNTELKALPQDPVDPANVRLEVIEREVQALKKEQSRIQGQIAAYQAKVDAAPLREQELVELTRNYDTSKLHYQALLDKSFTIGMAADLEEKQKGERFTVLDPAQVPQKPFKPKRAVLFPFSSLVALALSIGAVVAKEMISPAIKTESELKGLLPTGVPLVGFIPYIETPVDRRRKRRVAVLASVVCLILCAAVALALWRVRASL